MTVTFTDLVRMPAPLDWTDADQIARAAGASLSTVDPALLAQWHYVLNAAYQPGPEFPLAWTGAHHALDGSWVWADGAQVPLTAFAAGEPNADANPANDTPWVALNHGSLQYALGAPVSALLVSFSQPSVLGTPYDDWIAGHLGTGQVLRLGNGDDTFTNIGGELGGTIVAGNGNDVIDLWYEDGRALTVYDGRGADVVIVPGATVIADPDFADDYYQVLGGKISYATSIHDISATYELGATGADIGSDFADAREFVSGSGNDHIFSYDRIIGGAGDDFLQPYYFAEGGTGNDTLVASKIDTYERGDDPEYAPRRVELRGGEGNDTFLLYVSATLSGGSGTDHYIVKAIDRTFEGQILPITINDLQVGERIDISALLAQGITDPFAQGYLRQASAGGYTSLLFDANGGGDDCVAILEIKGRVDLRDYLDTSAYQLDRTGTALGLNFDLGILHQTLADGTQLDNVQRINFRGGNGADSARGGDFADVLNGGGGADALWGERGNDLLVGGSGDQLYGGSGNDVFEISSAPQLIDGGLGHDLLRVTNDIAFGRVPVSNLEATVIDGIEEIEIDDGVSVSFAPHLYGLTIHAALGATGGVKIQGSHGDDTITGGSGNDHLDGSAGADLLFGGSGDDILEAKRGQGADYLDGGAGLDRLDIDLAKSAIALNIDISDPAILQKIGNGTSIVNIEQIRVVGGSSSDQITGGALDDAIDGWSGNDVLAGGAGADTMQGGVGDDVLDGGAGSDRIAGGAGNDILTGGEGARDIFVYADGGFGIDHITDFEPGVDQLDLRGVGANGLAISLNQVGNDVYLWLATDSYTGTIILNSFAAADVTSNDWIL